MPDIELQLTVENLLARYVHAIDDDRLEEWPGFFVEQGIYRNGTYLSGKQGKTRLFRHSRVGGNPSFLDSEGLDPACAGVTNA